MSEQLSLCGIQQHYLSPEAQQSLKLLVQLACVLQITQTTPQALLSAWAMLVVRHSKATTVQVGMMQVVFVKRRMLEEGAGITWAASHGLSWCCVKGPQWRDL